MEGDYKKNYETPKLFIYLKYLFVCPIMQCIIWHKRSSDFSNRSNYFINFNTSNLCWYWDMLFSQLIAIGYTILWTLQADNIYNLYKVWIIYIFCILKKCEDCQNLSLEGLLLISLVLNVSFSWKFLHASKKSVISHVFGILTEPDIKCLHEMFFFLGGGAISFFFCVSLYKRKQIFFWWTSAWNCFALYFFKISQTKYYKTF